VGSHSGLVACRAAAESTIMYIVYILRSKKNDKHYVGHTADLNERLRRHNGGMVKSTKAFTPWAVILTEEFVTKSEAYKRELEIKSYKGGFKFKELIGGIA